MKLDDLIERTFQANNSEYTILSLVDVWWSRSQAMIVLKNGRISTYSKYGDYDSLEEWIKTVKWLT